MKLKVKAYDKTNERWLEPHELNVNTDKDGILFFSDSSAPFNRYGEVVLVLWTGLKDKNGVDIYEGDIVKGKSNNYSIEFQQSGGWVTNNNLPLWAFHEPEVIGNIYENKDLLK